MTICMTFFLGFFNYMHIKDRNKRLLIVCYKPVDIFTCRMSPDGNGFTLLTCGSLPDDCKRHAKLLGLIKLKKLVRK